MIFRCRVKDNPGKKYILKIWALNSFLFDIGTNIKQFQNAPIEMYMVQKCKDPCTFQWQRSV